MLNDQQDSAQEDWIHRLCPECGLCCNGVLFADVQLVREDNPLVLERVGLRLSHRGGKTSFDQPCSCFDGRLCTAYECRPVRCRRFDCHTLKQAGEGEITGKEALLRIHTARRKAAEVGALLRALGQTDEHLAFTTRYQAVMNQPINLAHDESAAERRGELMLAVSELMDRLRRDLLG